MRLDAFARKHGIKRSRLITMSVESYIRAWNHRAGRRARKDAETRNAGEVSVPTRPSPLAAMAG